MLSSWTTKGLSALGTAGFAGTGKPYLGAKKQKRLVCIWLFNGFMCFFINLLLVFIGFLLLFWGAVLIFMGFLVVFIWFVYGSYMVFGGFYWFLIGCLLVFGGFDWFLLVYWSLLLFWWVSNWFLLVSLLGDVFLELFFVWCVCVVFGGVVWWVFIGFFDCLYVLVRVLDRIYWIS